MSDVLLREDAGGIRMLKMKSARSTERAQHGPTSKLLGRRSHRSRPRPGPSECWWFTGVGPAFRRRARLP